MTKRGNQAPAHGVYVVRWTEGPRGLLEILDQRLLPDQIHYLPCEQVAQVWQAIRQLSVRGAPAIGIAAAYGVVLAAYEATRSHSEIPQAVLAAAEYLATSRPTAVNLFWALDRMRRVVSRSTDDANLPDRLLAEARAIHAEDRAMCDSIGAHGAPLLESCHGILTHCNAGALATGGRGTALAPLYSAWDRGKRFHVYADETRPLLQGARLTAWELLQYGIPVTVLCDNMAGALLRSGAIQAVIVGADRIAANGDTANKIGTYGLAILAGYHRVPFYVAAPSSTFDPNIEDGDAIPIEQRDDAEVTRHGGKQMTPDGVSVFNPAFDVTPASLITAIITERGVIAPVNRSSIRQALQTVFDGTTRGREGE